MSRDGSVSFAFAGCRRRFRLAWGDLIQLQEACDAGPLHVLRRLSGLDWRVGDIDAPLLLGLVGGGMAWADAEALMAEHVTPVAPARFLPAAQLVLASALSGDPEDQPAKPPKSREASRSTVRDKVSVADLYGAAAAIGWSPDVVKRLSVWEFSAAVSGWAAANCPDDGKLSASEADELWIMVQDRMARN